jgi:S-formylglutathione hydrolase FrmB
MQAVVPAPDGGYPGANTAEGKNALLSLTTGGFNTAVDWLSMRSAVGVSALVNNTSDNGNIALGFSAGNAVGHNMQGEPESVRYEQINAMLLNEFLREHRKNEEQNSKIESQAGKIQEQETIIAELKSAMKALAATVNEQASQLQKVSAQLEKTQSATRLVAENP